MHVTVHAAIAAAHIVDREAARWIGALGALVPAWAAASALVATSGPLAALLVWIVDALRLGPAQDDARAARLLGLVTAVVVGVAWAVAWAVGLTGANVAPAAGRTLTPADSAAAPLGGAVLTLALVSGVQGPRTPLLGLVAWLYLVGRVGVGVDGPLEAVAEIVSALVANGLVRHRGDLRERVHAAATRLGGALGLSTAPADT